MTSRRPMTRSFSGNGRTSSFSEEEGSSSNGRSESRNTYLSNVRPENRSTLCSVMAQLTEDIQPSFETTLKSKAVSENCNVKFTCVVSGYPAPELKWYKDDMEMDRYCGLPKYEIRRNGKTHTLHIYNCTLDDAAIYQVSASNSKGIVSCSGVLEVGIMNEYKIHQRFFAKLKQKAEKKKKELEDHTKKDKENIQREKLRDSPERPQRKRPIPQPELIPAVKEPEVVEELGAAAEPNGVSSEVKETAPVTSIDNGLENEILPSELAKKKIKITEETLQSQATDEKQNSPGVEEPREMLNPIINASKEQERKQKEEEEQEECEREKKREQELALEKEKGKERLSEIVHMADHPKHGSEVKHHKTHKDHDHYKIQTSISSMLHTVKDFFFGKGKKDSHDHIENKGREFDHMPTSSQPYPPQPQTPPSFHLQLEHHPEVYKPLTDKVVTMETDKQNAPSETVDKEQQSVSPELLKPHKHTHEDSILHTELPPAQKLPSGNVEESTGQSIKEADDAVEAMEGEDRDSQLSLHHQHPDCLVVSLQLNQQTQDESSHVENISVLPEAQDAYEEECPLTSTLTSLKYSWTPPYHVISATGSHNLSETPTETGREEEVGKEAEPNTEEGHSSTKLCEEEKAEVKSKEQPCSDIKRSENTKFTALSLEERIETRESKTPESILLPLSAVEVHSLERDNFKDEAECASLTQEMNVGFPTTAAPESLKKADLKIQQECTPIAEESSDVHNHSAIQSSNSDFRSSEERSVSKEVLLSDSEKDFEVNLCNNQDQAILECKSTEARIESLGFEMETEKKTQVKVEELDDSKILPITQNETCMNSSEQFPQMHYATCTDDKEDGAFVNTHVSDTLQSSETPKVPLFVVPPISVTCHETNLRLPNKCESSEPETSASTQEKTKHDVDNNVTRPLDKVPHIQISSCIEAIKPVVPDLNPNEHFIIPKIEIMEPELKECTLPLTILALDKTESEPALLQKHDATEVIIKEQGVPDSSDLLLMQKGTQSDYNPSLTEKVKEVVQFHDETEMLEHEQIHMKSSEQLPQMDYATIPVINVSCTDDKEDGAFVNTHVSDTLQSFETPKVPLFVVPPISITCHENDLTLPTQYVSTETETLADKQKGTKHDVDNNVTTKPEKTQNQEEMAEKSITENTALLQYEAPTPKFDDNVPSLSKTTDDSIAPEILKTKPPKDAKIENSVTVEDLLRNRSSVERLTFKLPTHPPLSPASLRKYMSKAAPDSDNEAVTAVPVITVGDRQSDKADEDLSGGSTPTSSLSCESSPRLKRRDSLSLIRSATPEELASGARRKIFIPKTKEDGEGILSALDTQSKKETPYMSPSQARRAALLQAPMGQNTPPMERRSPLLSRRKATLDVPKVVEETPTEEPVSTKQEEKLAEKKLDPLKAPQVIRKIRGEPFPDASGHLKLWCQFFNVLSDSTIKWYRDEEEILEVKRSGGDESQVALAIVLASSPDCGVYGCTIKNEYGTDTTDFLLSVDILSEILLKDDLEVGEEIEMTPLLFTKGIADCGIWGNKYFGRIMTETVHIGEGCAHKASRVKVIYGLDPVFESGSTCIIKIQNPIAYGTKQESNLTERNLAITRQECKIQNLIREYCKIFAAEARVTENFGNSLEYQGLTECGSPEVFEQFLTHHQCNYYCGLLGLRPLKTMDSLQQPTKTKGSRSPLLNRKLNPGSGSPQLQRKGQSPQMSRKATSSPKVTRKVQETEENKSGAKLKAAETLDVLETR
ncbi:hypothetical protein PAMP_019730 [Pampus punctatissimus]